MLGAGVLRRRLAMPGSEEDSNVMGRWRKATLCCERAWLREEFTLQDGRSLEYRQLEGQFSNPNAAVAKASLEWLISLFRRHVPKETDLLELFSGFGHNTVALAPYCRHITSVEINRSLAEAAGLNLEINKVGNAQVLRCPAEVVTRVLLSGGAVESPEDEEVRQAVEGRRFTALLVDPPRSGLDETTLYLAANFDHVFSIACNPQALRVNLEALKGTHQVVQMVALDMFPYTSHMEVLVYLRRNEPTLAT